MTRAIKYVIPPITCGGENLESLFAMLETKRPHNSKTESGFCKTFLSDIPGIQSDEFGNMYVRVDGRGDDILWTSHVDTVHFKEGRQSIDIDKNGIVSLAKRSKSNCLGADDTAGVWLMLEMIRAGKPGFYIFHRGEEHGGLGSHYIARDIDSPLLAGIRAAIALDRRGFDSVVTRQGDRCASDEFAESLATGLGIKTLRPDDSGVFTDTANYIDHIGECSNLSVGYFDQHRATEFLDVGFLVRLRAALIRLDTDSLVIKREPGAPEPESHDPREFWSHHFGRDSLRIDGDYANIESGEIARLCRDKPEICARAIQNMGITLDEFLQWTYDAEMDMRDSAPDDDIPF